jgi:cytochrome c
MVKRIGLAALVLMASASMAWAEGDAERGKTVFGRCSGCHSLTAADAKPTGPHLEGLFGRTAGSVEGARYSDAMKGLGIVWDEATLDNYLAAPTQAVPGTTMMVGVPDAQDRADLIAYLKLATQPQ